MKRRQFFAGLASVAAEPQVRRVYSFIWSNPVSTIEMGDLSAMLKDWYHPDIVRDLVFGDRPALDMFRRDIYETAGVSRLLPENRQ